jgi:probable F420-dependent oxidoreductase
MDCWASPAFLDTDVQLEAARCADELGFAGLAVSDHLFYAQQYRSRYPYTADGGTTWEPGTHWPDPWALISAMAVITHRIRFTTNVYVAPARDLFTVAKAVSTADVLSGGRVSLGLAAGWCEEEFEQTGQAFNDRGKRLDDMIPALRTLWSGGMVSYSGSHHRFGPLQVSPAPVGPIPLHVGGNSPAAIRRAATLGDGWIVASSPTPDQFEPMLSDVLKLRAAGDRAGEPFEVIVALAAMPDVDLYRRFEDLGVTGVLCAPWMLRRYDRDHHGYSADDVRQSMERFAEKIIEPLSR